MYIKSKNFPKICYTYLSLKTSSSLWLQISSHFFWQDNSFSSFVLTVRPVTIAASFIQVPNKSEYWKMDLPLRSCWKFCQRFVESDLSKRNCDYLFHEQLLLNTRLYPCRIYWVLQNHWQIKVILLVELGFKKWKLFYSGFFAKKLLNRRTSQTY